MLMAVALATRGVVQDDQLLLRTVDHLEQVGRGGARLRGAAARADRAAERQGLRDYVEAPLVEVRGVAECLVDPAPPRGSVETREGGEKIDCADEGRGEQWTVDSGREERRREGKRRSITRTRDEDEDD